nr:MAG: c-type cytochrome [Hyphomicrobiales bacterium]
MASDNRPSNRRLSHVPRPWPKPSMAIPVASWHLQQCPLAAYSMRHPIAFRGAGRSHQHRICRARRVISFAWRKRMDRNALLSMNCEGRGKAMKISTAMLVSAFFSILGSDAWAAQFDPVPAWAYPVMEPGRERGPDDGTLHSVEGSKLSLTQTEIGNGFGPADWFPDEHPPMPGVVAHGTEPRVRACSLCHLPSGSCHPESANLAGLSSPYIYQQLKDFKSGARRSGDPDRPGIMVTIARDMTDAQMREAADYFAALPQVKWNEVVEAEMVPKTYVAAGNMRHALPDGGMEPIGSRIIEIPTDSERAELRDPHSPFVAYVPPGALAKGKELAATGGDGKTFQCAMCHGPELKGTEVVPGIAGRSPIYLARQMLDMQDGARNGEYAVMMVGMVPNLSEDDIVNLAAYVGSLDP